MQLKLVPPPDLRDPDDPAAQALHRDLCDVPPRKPAPHDPVRRFADDVRLMTSRGIRYWLPEGTSMADALKAAAPRLLFARGQPDLRAPAVGMVGTRRPDAYGADFAYRLGRAVAAAGCTVVSGGALGIDTEAHRGALDAGGRTTIVLGNGLVEPHPIQNRPLFDRAVAAGSAVVSEYPPEQPAMKHQFPERNRLIAALADAVVVVQAGAVSGALITAAWARSLGVPCFAVPGDAWYERSSGSLALLRQGARPLAAPADLEAVTAFAGLAHRARWPRPGARMRGLPIPWRDADAIGFLPTPCHDDRVLEALSAGLLPFDELLARTGLAAGELQAHLLALEIDGLVRRMPGGAFLATGASEDP